jgi:hypothetical protein
MGSEVATSAQASSLPVPTALGAAVAAGDADGSDIRRERVPITPALDVRSVGSAGGGVRVATEPAAIRISDQAKLGGIAETNVGE